MLKVTNLQSGYGNGSEILHGISFEIAAGECVALLGPNGVGKTTTLRTISGVLKPTHGQIEFDGHNITTLDAHRRPKMGLAHSPEGRQVFATLSAVDNLALAADFSGHAKQFKANQEKVYALFPRLAERADQLAGTMSGGEQQMLAIGRALMMSPKVLMLDEPSLGLAPLLVNTVFAALAELRKTGISILIVEQFAMKAIGISERVLVLNHGEIVDQGEAKLFDNDRLQAAYLK